MITDKKKKELNGCEPLNSCVVDMVHNKHIQDNSTILAPKSQCLQDVSAENQLEKELKEKFTPKKSMGEKLVFSYLRLGYDDKAEKVANCGTLLEFAKYSDEKYKLHRANFCRDRLCPLCAWRRSYKIFGQVSQIMDVIEKDYTFIFLTLTVRSCDGERLSELITRMNKAWAKFIKYSRIKKICKGFFRGLEITYNKETDMYHPHFHVIIAVPKGYFAHGDYIKQSEWLDMWRKAMKDPRILILDVRRVRSKDATSSGADMANALKSVGSAVAEIAKYAVKSADYLFESEQLTDFCVYTFTESLRNRRLCAMGGCFLEAHQKLQLDDTEDGDLIHVDGEIRSDVAIQIVKYGWSCGAYKLIAVEDKALDVQNVLAEYEDE